MLEYVLFYYYLNYFCKVICNLFLLNKQEDKGGIYQARKTLSLPTYTDVMFDDFS